MWICNRCESYNPDEMPRCRICGSEKQEDTSAASECSYLSSSEALDSEKKAELHERNTEEEKNFERSAEPPAKKTESRIRIIESTEYDDLPDPHKTMISNAIEDRRQQMLRMIKTILLISVLIGIFAGLVFLLISCGNNYSNNQISEHNAAEWNLAAFSFDYVPKLTKYSAEMRCDI